MGLTMRLAFFAALFLWCGAAYASTSGLRATISSSALATVKNATVPLVDAILKNATIPLPDMHLDEHVAEPIGHITLDLTQIRISGVDIISDATALAITPPGVSVSFAVKFSLSLGYKWRKVHWPHGSDHGTIDASTGDGAVVVMNTQVDVVNRRPQLQVLNVKPSLGDFKIKFHGKIDWLYNLVVKLFKGKVLNAIDSAIVKALTKAVDVKLDGALAKMNTTHRIGSWSKGAILVDTSMTDANATGSHLVAGATLDVTDFMTNTTCPLPPQELPTTLPGAMGLQVILGGRFWNCWLWSLDTNGVLATVLKAKDIPKGSPLQLNTTSWKLLIPPLYKAYPDRLMQLTLTPVATPVVSFSTKDGVSAVLCYHMNNSVVMDDGSLHYTHTIKTTFTIGIGVSIAQTKNLTTVLHGNITKIGTNITVEDSAIGHIDPSRVLVMFNALEQGVKAAVNTLFAKGTPLPALPLNMVLKDPRLWLSDGFLGIQTDLQLSTTSNGLVGKGCGYACSSNADCDGQCSVCTQNTWHRTCGSPSKPTTTPKLAMRQSCGYSCSSDADCNGQCTMCACPTGQCVCM